MKIKKTLRVTAFLALLALALPVFSETGQARHKKLYAVPTPGKVVVDGKLDDWDLSAQIEMYAMSETRDQGNGKFALMYDAEALYISGDVRDPTPMVNRNDPLVRSALGWTSDSCQVRLSLDPADGYPLKYSQWGGTPEGKGVGKVVDMTLWYFTDEKKPVLSILKGLGGALHIVPENDYQAAYRMHDDAKGYTFEYRIPWATFGAKRPFKGGDLMGGQVQFNYGNAAGLELASFGLVCYDVMLHAGFPFQTSECWGKIIFAEAGNIAKELVEEGIPPERPLPLTFDYSVPEDGLVSLVLFNASNDAVRILTASSPRSVGEAHDAWDGMDSLGNPLPAGDYTWKGVVHQPMRYEVKMSVHNSGTPGYATDDKSSSWGADHCVPTVVCAIPGGMLLAWEGTEMGSAMIRTDLNGRKKWGARTGAQHLTSDGKRFFVAGEDGFQRIKTVRGYMVEDARPVNFGNGQPELAAPEGVDTEDHHAVSGLAYGDGKLYVSYKGYGAVCVYDATSGDLKETIAVSGSAGLPTGTVGVAGQETGAPRTDALRIGVLAYDAAGKRLLAVIEETEEAEKIDGRKSTFSISSISTSSISSASSLLLSSSSLDSPKGITVAKDGSIYVSNQGALQNISVFDANGKYLRSIGKQGGRPARGLYDQNGMYMPRGVAIAEDGRLWVAEYSDFPRRHSVWKNDAFDKEFFGGCSYFGWVWMDTADPKHVYSHNVKWEIDMDAGTWKPISTIWRETKANEVTAVNPNGYGGALRVFTANNGRQYAFGGSWAGPVFYRCDGDVFKPFAAVIEIKRSGWASPVGGQYSVLFTNPEKYPDGNYWWQDLNDDQIVQEDEVYRPDRRYDNFMFKWLDRDLNMWCHKWGEAGAILSPTRVDEKTGQPFYDRNFIGEHGKDFPAQGIYMSDDDSQLYVFRERDAFMRLNKEDGKPMWAYRNLVGWHQSLGYPMARPGLIHGLTHPLGVAGEFTGVVTYFNPYHIWTTDGIYVTALLRDGRDGKGLGPDVIATEAIQGQLVKLNIKDKDRYFLLAGANDGRITEIFGLDTVKRLSGGTYVHTAEMAETAVKARQDYDRMIAKSKKLDIQRTRAALDTAPAVERIVDDARRFAVQATYDAERLYVRYVVQTPNKLSNAEPDTKLIFKGGNCLDIQIDVSSPVDGVYASNPLRLLVTRQGGKPLAMLYRKTVNGAKEPYTFKSPTGEETFDRIEDVSGNVALDYKEQPDGFTAVVAIPQALLGLSLKPAQELRLDVGYLFGNKEGNQTLTRAYWSNNGFSANVILDIPNESRLTPEEWGRAVVE